MKNTALGKGLGALLGDVANQPSVDTGGAVTLRLSEIEPNKDQPRKHFDEAALAELADSIRTHGVLSPLLVRRLPAGNYQIIAGERRWRAARMAGVQTLPVVVHEADDRLVTEMALIENLQREDLNPVEIAEGYQVLIQEFGLTQEEVSERVGRSRSAVANMLRLLHLSKEILDLVSKGTLSEGHARTLLPLFSHLRPAAAAKMQNDKMTVRQAEAYVKTLMEAEKQNALPPVLPPLNYLADTEKSLSAHWGRKITVKTGKKGGKVEIEYYDADDLEVLSNRLLQ